MDSPKAEVREAAGFGVGLFARETILAGEVIASFDGKRYENWDPADFPPEIDDYPIQYGEEAWRDSEGFARFANHSCQPNAGIKELFDVVAMVDIPAGDEIRWDYDMSDDADWSIERCRCGTEGCRGTVNGYKNLPEGSRKAYAGFISGWLMEKYAEV